LRAVNAAHYALRDVLALSVAKTAEIDDGPSSQTRLPKELLQTCIRPVLMQLREYTRLSVPLLRGLSRLLSLLSSWFNKTLGEKLLDHLRRWTEPSVISALKIWKEGEEPLVAAAIVDLFSSLPHASHFVEHLVKTCIKLESTLHLFKARFVESPYRRPLARYLNKHAQFAISFFFPRFKTPMYSELFQYIVELEESVELRESLSNKQYSDLLLHVCFERPLAIIRSEKGASPGGAKNSLSLHGIGKPSSSESDPGLLLPMNIEALEMQHQGLRLVYTLMSYIPNYFRDHNDIVRACRWLWRSKGRLLRQQYEEIMSPRFHSESKQLAVFRMNYAKSSPSEALDILFELFRVFLQPSTVDFALVSRFLVRMVTEVLTIDQKKKVFQRFFASITGDTNEEIKVLGIQFLVVPMVAAEGQRNPAGNCNMKNDEMVCTSTGGDTAGNHGDHSNLIDSAIIEKFVGEVLFQDGTVISCGLRLKIELLRLLDLFVEYNFLEIEQHQESAVQFCIVVLKSENVTCRCWAYVVLSRVCSVFCLPAKLALDCYFALLKIQEERKLVRTSLDLLVPMLPVRLDRGKFEDVIEDTIHLLADEGISIPHLAQVNQTIVRNFGIFESHCNRLAPHMIRCLDRLALQPGGPQENRFLAVNIIELILIWDEKVAEMRPLLDENADLLCNFLIRLKFVIAELPVDSRHHSIPRIKSLLDTLMAKGNIAVQFPPIEKLLRKETKSSFPVLAFLEILSTSVKYGYRSVLYRNTSLVQAALEDAVHRARSDIAVQKELRMFVSCSRTSYAFSSILLAILDNAIVECQSEPASASSDRSTDRSRSKDQPAGSTNVTDSTLFILFALEIIAGICRENGVLFNVVRTTLISLAKSLSKAHLSDATAKQRQGSSSTVRSSASDVRYHTPTIGILEEAYIRDRMNSTKHSKSRYGKELIIPDAAIRSLIVLLSVFEASGCICVFSESRNSLLLLITNILEASDNVQVLMASVRCVGKWVLYDGFGPLTTKERSNLLGRIATLDLRNFGDDVVTQPLSDLIAGIALRCSSNNFARDEVEVDRIIASCVLSANTSTRHDILHAFMSKIHFDDPCLENSVDCFSRLLWLFCRADFEGIGARFWIVALVDFLLHPLVASNASFPVESLSCLSHGSIPLCLELFHCLLRWAWKHASNDTLRVRLIAAFESLLAKPYHVQFLRPRSEIVDTRCLTPVRALLSTIATVNPIPVFDTNLLLSVAENYSCWYEVVLLLERQFFPFKAEPRGEILVSALRHCYQYLGDYDAWRSLARESVILTTTGRALSLDVYDSINESVKYYSELMEGAESELDPTDFEMDLWEDRWILLQKELCQFQVVSEFASASDNPELQMECAWKAQDWSKVRNLSSSSGFFAAVEQGDPVLKMSETMLAVADGKLSEVENLHAQTAQLCLYKWQLLPQISSGSQSHSSLLHFFHRLVEIRESGQIMFETSNHSNGKTLPDLKNLLSAWRHRLPNEWETLSVWDEIFVWRAHMFSSISSNFAWCEPETLATQHDRPWTALRMAKTARKQGLREVTQLLLSKVTDEQAMNVSDAYSKVRERILTFYNLESDEKSKQERQGGLSLINTTNLSFFDSSQNSEIFRLRAIFLQSLQGRSKANQAFCHSVQICPTHARAWDSWGELCSSLGAAAEKQIEQNGGSNADMEANKDAVKKVRQYLAQSMGCYIEAIQIDGHEWARLRIPKCLWMLSKDGSSPGVLCQTIESRGVHLPSWVWLPWIPQLLTSLYRKEGRAIKSIFARLVKTYPQAVYYPLRTFYLERRDVDRGKSSSTSASATESQTSVSHAEDLMSLLRRSHAALWSALEPCLEELIVKFRHSYEEELLATIVVLLERTETHFGNFGKKDDESAVISSVWKTLGKIAVKFFRHHEHDGAIKDIRAEKTAKFKTEYKSLFESDFHVSSVEQPTSLQTETDCPIGLNEIIEKLRCWKRRLEDHVLTSPYSISLVESSHSLAMFGVGDAPDLWPGSCDPLSLRNYSNDRECTFDSDATTTPSTTSSSAAAARKAAKLAADAASEAARREGVGGDYGGGSSCIEIPGQYIPHTSAWTDIRPSPELHVKLLKFEPTVSILRRNDTLVRRVGMLGSDGKIYYFLLQIGVSYLSRTDERTSQTLYILDKVLRRDIKSARTLISVQSHPVIPVAQRLRLMYEPESRSSLEDIYRELCAKKNVHYSDLSTKFSDDVKRILAEKVAVEAKEGKDLIALEKTVRLDVFSSISSSELCDSSMLVSHSMTMLSGAEPFYQFKRIFAQQWATNCLLQYTFSAMDRTPSKVVFDYGSGRVHAPEFRISYTNQGVFDNPHTPFRLTPNLVSLIGFPFLDSRYTKSMALTAGAVQHYQMDLDPVFRLLMRDDLIAYFTKSMAKSDATTVEMEKQLAGSVARNVSILHARFAECAPNPKGVVTKQHLHVDQRVRDLMDSARNFENLCLMPGSYQGWL
jgi:FAT domain/Phosphatidylinositol 3- and 4-kinase